MITLTYDSISHTGSILDSKVSKPAETLDSNRLARRDAHVADRVEDGHAGAKERSVGGWVGVGWNAHDGFGVQYAVFRI